MTIYINDAVIEKVKENIDIVNVISEYIPLKKTGSNYLGLCPFHNEKTPSFTVSETKQIFHCFGCGEGGDGVTFIMKKENIDFPDAIKVLADKMGIELEEGKIDNNFEAKNKTYEINKEAARFFYNNLTNNTFALEYLKRRLISYKTIRQFGLGFSYDSWDKLYKFLSSKGYKPEEIEATGLIGKKSGNNGYYDKFRNRIMFPIIDTKSRVIGFGGRVLDSSMPKYLNSPDTIVYNKGNHLYGLNLLNKLSDRKRIILVEGYMDVIALFSKGIDYSVASLGTALTERQSKVLKRYGEEVYICYDSDIAGTKATLKAIDILLKSEVNPRIILLPDGMDPDDFINKKGLAEFEKSLVNSSNHIDYKIFINKKKYNLNKPEDKVKFTIEVARIIKELKSPIEQDVYINKISIETNISKDAIEREIKGTPYKVKKENSLLSGQKKNLNDSIKPINSMLTSARDKAEMDLINFMITEKDHYDYISTRIFKEDFLSIECKEIYEFIDFSYKNEEVIDEKVLLLKILEIPNLDKERVRIILNHTINFQPSNIDKIIDDLIYTIKYSNLLIKRKNIITKIEELEKKIRNEEEEKLFIDLCLKVTAINKEINSLAE